MPQAILRESTVLLIQRLLRARGRSLGAGGPQNDGVDGDWGPTTQNALLTELGYKPPAAPPTELRSAPHIPAAYGWLAQHEPLPLMVWEGLQLLGTKEAPGSVNSDVIMGWAAETGLAGSYTTDATPWCGLWAAVVAKRSGKDFPTTPLWALSWSKFGVAAGQPRLGDVLVFQREGGGHVGLYIAEDAEAYHVLGGNQGDQVSIIRVAKNRLYAARRPVYKDTPASVQPYIVAKTGALSTNEA